jgi:hypothetical protein
MDCGQEESCRQEKGCSEEEGQKEEVVCLSGKQFL